MVDGVDVLVFDMDGVLVDVSASYRETIIRTVEYFTGKAITNELIQNYKNQGGYNNDWILSQKICGDFGRQVDYNTVVDRFNDFFLRQGYIHRERWLPQADFLERLSRKHELAIFTGRTAVEAEITLDREKCRDKFLLVSADDVKEEKPAPEGLLKIAADRPGKRLLYFGDTVDDARASRAAAVEFIGVCGPENPRREELSALLIAEGAVRVIGDINEIC